MVKKHPSLAAALKVLAAAGGVPVHDPHGRHLWQVKSGRRYLIQRLTGPRATSYLLVNAEDVEGLPCRVVFANGMPAVEIPGDG